MFTQDFFNAFALAKARTRVAGAALVAGLVAVLLAPIAAAQSGSISGTGIGGATVGSTLAQMQADLGSDYEFVPVDQVIVDFGGYEVRKGGVTQFFAAGDPSADELTVLITDNPSYTTAAGLGASSLLADAEAAYGVPTLTYNNENEGREFANFANHPDSRIVFRTDGGGGRAGIYADPDASFGETMQYVDGAMISAVWITCVAGRDCPQRYLPETGPSDVVPQLLIGFALIAGGALFLAAERRAARDLFDT